jgi:hypothetical protein
MRYFLLWIQRIQAIELQTTPLSHFIDCAIGRSIPLLEIHVAPPNNSVTVVCGFLSEAIFLIRVYLRSNFFMTKP